MHVPAAAIRNAERCVEASVAPADPSAGQVSVRAALVVDEGFFNVIGLDTNERIAQPMIASRILTKPLEFSGLNVKEEVSLPCPNEKWGATRSSL